MRTVPWRLGGVLVAATGAAGLAAAGLTVLLHLVQHLAFGGYRGGFEAGVLAASPARRVAALAVCGLVAGGGWYLLGRTGHRTVRVRVAVRDRVPMRTGSTTVEALLQIVVVGLGASLGRESAPRRISGAAGDLLARGARLPPEQVRLVTACAAGAGFGAVYNVPAAGAVFALEVLLRSRRVSHVVVAGLVAGGAAAVAWLEVPRRPFYDVDVAGWSWWLLLAAVVAGPVAGVAGLAFERVTAWAGAHRARGWRVPVVAVVVFVGLGLLATRVPSLLGNGRGPAQLAFDGDRTVLVLLLLAAAKPLATAACLRTGATGGLVTPAIATGALLGAGLGGLATTAVPGVDPTVVAVLAVAGVLAVTMRAPLTGFALAWELTGVPWWCAALLAVATGGAWATTRGWRRPPV